MMFGNGSRIVSVLVKDQALKKKGHSPIGDLDNLTQDASSRTVPDEPTVVSRVCDADLVGSQVRELKQIDTVRRIRVKLSTVAREARRGTGGQVVTETRRGVPQRVHSASYAPIRSLATALTSRRPRRR
jgi:hypothetical protein